MLLQDLDHLTKTEKNKQNNIVYNVVYNVTIKGIAWVLIQYTFNVYSGLNRGFERDLQILKLMTYQGATVLLF